MLESHVKYFFVSEEDVLRRCMRPFPSTVGIIQHTELPTGYSIKRVEYSSERTGFLFLVYHPTFPKVSVGAAIPVVSSYDTNVIAYKVIPCRDLNTEVI